MDINHPHASFAESVLKDVQTSSEILQNLLPQEIAQSIEWSTLETEDTSFVDESLRNLYSDILFSAQKSGGELVSLYILLEHKSHPDVHILKQLLGYQKEIYSRQEIYAPVIPIVFYHGQEKWNIPQVFSSSNGVISRYALNFSYILIDLQKINFADFHFSLTSLAILHIFKEIWIMESPEKFLDYITLIRDLIESADAVELLQKIFVYIYAVHDIKPETAKKTMEAVFIKGDVAMSTAELLIREGMEQGIQKGIQKGRQEGELRKAIETARNMLAEHAELAFVLRTTGLTEEQLRINGLID